MEDSRFVLSEGGGVWVKKFKKLQMGVADFSKCGERFEPLYLENIPLPGQAVVNCALAQNFHVEVGRIEFQCCIQ